MTTERERYLKMTRGDTLDVELLGGVASQLENLGGEVLQDRGGVDSGGRTWQEVDGCGTLVSNAAVDVDAVHRETKQPLNDLTH